MTEIKTFRLEGKFNSVQELYTHLQKNINTLENLTGIKIQKPLKERLYCLTAKEKITERQILIFASEETAPENIGELIILAGAFKADILIFFVKKISPAILEPFNWLHQTCHQDTQIILGEAIFKNVSE